MKKSLLQLSVCILMGVILLLAGGATAAKAADVEAFRAAVQDIFDTYSAANISGDTDLYISLWDEDGIKMGPNKPAVFGKSAIGELKRKAAQKWDYESQNIKVEEVQVAGDWGFARGTYTASLKPKAGGETSFVEGKFLTIFKRQPDGSWKIFRDCYNSNVPPG